ncbi:tripartite tricarboxylate transporter TctB family protein [Paraburkholderia sp. ZP32-5]|uniref:tripartite tricarboxylate transporter TctB family protein n=1 Tax=Paraburkholderia sp. ZP32-5 TaxID=2883245 RepID=UPI001F270DC5|nr:tripartite tricarboxylate transporter TctB family protein [Paraburkholderia sp. ZP32-5]
MRGLRWATRHRLGGLLLVATGTATAIAGWRYGVGSVKAMGAGFMPTACGILLSLVGVAVLASGEPHEDAYEETPHGKAHGNSQVAKDVLSAWRGPGYMMLSVAAFVVLGGMLGLVAASFGSVYLAALADRKNSWREAALLATAATLVSITVFHYGLSLQMPLFNGEWF